MSQSQILTFYDQLAATSITVAGKAIGVKDADELPNTLTTAHLPVRLLTPMSPFLFENARSASFAVSGGSVVNQVDWQIADVLYWLPIAQEVGVRAVAKVQLEYMREYLELMSTAGTITLNNIWVNNIAIRAEMLEYPVFSGHWYYAVRAMLTVKEKIP